MLGGGTYTRQDKILPGSYINFINAAQADGYEAVGGVVALPLLLSWGAEEEVGKITKDEFDGVAYRLFGYTGSKEELRPIREIFMNANTIYYYRLNTNTVKAANDFAIARYGGIRGNDIKIVIRHNIDDESKFDVKTMLDIRVCDVQTVGHAAELHGNDFVTFKTDATLTETAGILLKGGTDGDGKTGESCQRFLDKMERYSFNVLVCNTAESAITNLFTAYTRRMREELGIKFQTVVYRGGAADYEGIISAENRVLGQTVPEYGLVCWAAGAAAGCAVNKSNTNKVYNGEYQVDTDYTQDQLADALLSGKFILHQVGDQVRILSDHNTLTTFTEEKGSGFCDNQTIRLLDQVGNDIAAMFHQKYMGAVPNDESGRTSLWNDIVTYFKQLVKIHAVEAFEASEIVVSAGDSKKSVKVICPVTPINSMSQLYMVVMVN